MTEHRNDTVIEQVCNGGDGELSEVGLCVKYAYELLDEQTHLTTKLTDPDQKEATNEH